MRKELLEKLRERLPRKSMKKIAEETGYSYVYVRMVMTGRSAVNSKNKCIVEKAIEMVQESERLEKDVEKLTGK
jgi:hypothetical protein